MASLSVTFGKELSPQITDIYWDALKPLAIEQFQEAARSCIRHSKHFPKPADLLERYEQMTQTASKPFQPLPPADRKWLAAVNSLFLKYLMKRRLDEDFIGHINIVGRRKECLSLVEWMEASEADGEASEEQLKILFDKAMARVQDKTQTKDWLEAQIDHQRRQQAPA